MTQFRLAQCIAVIRPQIQIPMPSRMQSINCNLERSALVLLNVWFIPEPGRHSILPQLDFQYRIPNRRFYPPSVQTRERGQGLSNGIILCIRAVSCIQMHLCASTPAPHIRCILSTRCILKHSHSSAFKRIQMLAFTHTRIHLRGL